MLGELKADILDSQVKIPRKKFADTGNSIAEVRESLGAGSCEAFQSHGKEFGFYFECHGGPLGDLHLRVTQASVLKSLHRICAESRF